MAACSKTLEMEWREKEVVKESDSIKKDDGRESEILSRREEVGKDRRNQSSKGK